MSGPDRYLSAHEAAARCGVSERSVRRWIASGQLKADKSGREFRISERDLEPFSLQRESSNGHIADSPDVSATAAAVAAERPDSAAAVELVRLVEKLQQQNLELAGRVGYLQAELSQAREQLALMAPVATDAAASVAQHANGVSGVSAMADGTKVEHAAGEERQNGPTPLDQLKAKYAESSSVRSSLNRGPWGRFLGWLYG